ncbi:MAG: aldo/keto reductase [Burkholderiaceae bacterium]|nr:MAG: aldo/keto reductase [Burkholderiaceae bacterium]TBR75450.1 MAG: aldo/keto reductase [Burkholderiaceae bacterium]
MKQICIPGTTLQVSRLSFGTGSLHHLPSLARRRALLQAALEAGFTHFDTSPYYGFGLGELALGSLPAASRQRMTVATKVGLYGPNGSRAWAVDVYARKFLGKLLPSLNRAVVDWSLARARATFDDSLRRLKRESVDLLLLHEPVAAFIRTSEWLQWLQSLQHNGRIRHWGVAGEPGLVVAVRLHAEALAPVIQVRDSLQRHEADVALNLPGTDSRPMQLTYGYLAAQSGAARGGVLAEQCLLTALGRNATGSVLVSTRRIERIAGLAKVAAG